MNILDLYSIFSNEITAFNFATENSMLYQNMMCGECNCQMSLIHDSTQKWNHVWRCSSCHKKCSILYGSIFTYAKLPCNKVLYILYCWVHNYHCKDAAHEVKVNKNTVSFYYNAFRNACINYLTCMPKRKIGGPNCTVEIDETLMCHRKYNMGRMLLDIWIFGGICGETGEVFARVVENRKGITLWDLILENIEPGTKIISDSWKGYEIIDNQPRSHLYLHEYVNHSVNFVDPITGVHTQHVERLWRELKRINKKYEGIPRNMIAEHLAEFIFRRNEIQQNDPFFVGVNLMKNTFFDNDQ